MLPTKQKNTFISNDSTNCTHVNIQQIDQIFFDRLNLHLPLSFLVKRPSSNTNVQTIITRDIDVKNLKIGLLIGHQIAFSGMVHISLSATATSAGPQLNTIS